MVSSLHASVLGTNVPNMSSVSSVSSLTDATSASTSTSVSTSSYDSVSISSAGKMMASEGNRPPDFDSMSTEDFRAHLVELQEKMAADGVDTSGFTDPTTMSDEDLNALKDEMSAMGKGGPGGKQGPPPPPPPSETSTTSATETDTLQQLLETLTSEEEDATTDLINSLLGTIT